MAIEGGMAEVKAELARIRLEFVNLEGIQNPKIALYDNMTVEFASFNDSWKDEVQKRILKAEAQQKVANDRFDDLYQKSLVSLTEVHNQIAVLTATGGKGKGSKWELSRPKDIEPSTFDGKEDSLPKWKEELEDYIVGDHRTVIGTLGDMIIPSGPSQFLFWHKA